MTSGIVELADCTEFRQAVQARPPAVVHGTALLLTALLGAALAWAALTKADLVVRAPGRVRPVTSPHRVTASADLVTATSGGLIAEVLVPVGGTVRKGDALLRLDTERLDNEIARRKRVIETGEAELAKLGQRLGLLTDQYAAARAKAEVELAQAEKELSQAKLRQEADARLAALKLANSREKETRAQKLAAARAIPMVELSEAVRLVRETEQELAKAQVPPDAGRVEVLRRAPEVLEKDHAVRVSELEAQRAAKEGEVAAARPELKNLERQRRDAVLRSPVDGVLISGEFKPGGRIEAGQALEIAEERGFRFEVEVPSGEFADLQVEMPARIKLDAYDYQKYGSLTGTVTHIAPDSVVPKEKQAAVYLVRIDVDGDEVGRGEYRGHVKLGLSGQAEIMIGRESLLALLVKKVRRTISLG